MMESPHENKKTGLWPTLPAPQKAWTPDQPLPRRIAASECGILTQIKKQGPKDC
jgi:hypothetical protein